MEYNKLVRDKIPEIIKNDGEKPVIRIASEKEYGEYLKKKLQEEVNEFLEDESLEEFADVLEVLHNIADFKGFSHGEINEKRKRKNEKRGSFRRKIILEEIK